MKTMQETGAKARGRRLPGLRLRGRRVRGLFIAALALAGLAAQAAQARVLDETVIPRQAVDGLVPGELSGLAWDADEQELLAVSDRGQLFRFRVELDGQRLRAVTPIAAVALEAVSAKAPNAEGLALVDADNGRRGDTQLVVALENGPRIVRYTLQGKALGEMTLPEPLRDPEAYRSRNSRLEAVTLHPRLGLVTAPQRSLLALPPSQHRVYAADGSQWTIPALERGAVKGIEALPDGSLLVLERHGKGKAQQPVLRRIDPKACSQGSPCAAEPIPFAGLAAGDNYEGLAQLGQGLFLMVSDDGGKADRPSRLVLFRIEP